MSKNREMLGRTLVVLAFIVIALTSVNPIRPGDFWWHLASGRYIVENGEIPQADPFNYTSQDLKSGKEGILKGYWLAQSILYICVSKFGFNCVPLLRALVFSSIFAILYLLMRRRGMGRPVSLLIVLGILLGMRSYTVPKPAMISLPFSVLLFGILEELRTVPGAYRNYPLLAALPLVMIVWSNMHGAYIVGDGVILLFIASETVSSIKRRSLDRRFKVTVSLSVLALLASGLNPVGFEFLKPGMISALLSKGAAGTSASFGSIVEYYAPLDFFRLTGEAFYFYSLIAVSAALVLSIAVNWRRQNVFHLSMSFVFLAAGWISFRYGAFLFMFGALLTAYNIADFRWSRSEGIIFYSVPAAVALILSFLVWPSSWSTIQPGSHPSDAVSFIKSSGVPGRLFAPYLWGGYLDWSLYPEYKTFIDGRLLSEEVYWEYNYMMTGSQKVGARLERYGINSVLLFIVRTSDMRAPNLIFYLLDNEEWDVAYLDGLSIVFVRKGYGLPAAMSKAEAWKWLRDLMISWTRAYPDLALSHSQLGKVYFYGGLMDEAEKSFRKALSIDPGDSDSLIYMKRIKERR